MVKIGKIQSVCAISDQQQSNCNHQLGFILDNDYRIVTCKECGKWIDPYEALYKLALNKFKN